MRSYYLLFDVTVDVHSHKHAYYFSVDDGTDIVGVIEGFMADGHKIENLRMFRFTTKKLWNSSRDRWANGISDWPTTI